VKDDSFIKNQKSVARISPAVILLERLTKAVLLFMEDELFGPTKDSKGKYEMKESFVKEMAKIREAILTIFLNFFTTQ
jgi:hypothetical protein